MYTSTSSTCPDCAHARRAAIARIIERHVQETGDGRYVLAVWSDRNANWIADMSSAAARSTGCSQVSARRLEGIVGDPCVPKYSSRASAVRALRAGEILDAEGSFRDLCPKHRRELVAALEADEVARRAEEDAHVTRCPRCSCYHDDRDAC